MTKKKQILTRAVPRVPGTQAPSVASQALPPPVADQFPRRAAAAPLHISDSDSPANMFVSCTLEAMRWKFPAPRLEVHKSSPESAHSLLLCP